MRLIDADELVEELASYLMGGLDMLKKYNGTDTWSDGLHTAWRCIDDAPTVYKWIPVTDRKPTHDGYFLGTLKSGSVGTVSYSPTRDRFWLGGYYCDVIAWMELPEGYKE